jgi:PAS domain S-box-containing protein
MDPVENAIEENRRLRRTMRDLVALSTLPAVWTGLDPKGIARSLADVLLHALALDLVYIRLAGPTGESPIEVVRGNRRSDADDAAVRVALAPLLEADGGPPAAIPDPFGAGPLNVAVTRFGVGDDLGVLVAGSRRADFPTEQDRLLLGVGANQTAIVLQRRRAEEKVREQQEWFRVTLASVGDGVIATDARGNVTFLNGVAQELTGWTQEEAQGRPLEVVFVILHEQTRQPVENPVKKVLRDGSVVGLGNHTVLIAKDGMERPVDDSAAPIRDSAGKMIGVVLIFRDVTEQRRTERAIREREQQLQLVTGHAPVFLVHFDQDARYRYVNKRFADWLGLTTQDMIGRHIADVIGRRAYATLQEHIEAALAGRHVEFETEIPYEKVGPRVMRCAYAPEYDAAGRVVGLVAVIADVTERKRAEEALRQSEQRFARFMQHLPGLAWIKDTRGRYVYVNEAAEKAFRTPRADLYGRTDDEVFPPEVAARFSHNDRQAVASGSGIQVVETLEHEDGTLHFSLVTKFPVQGPDGNVAFVGGMAIDITDQRRAEEDVRHSEERFRSLMEQAPFSIQVLSPDGRTVRVNRAWEELWGLTLEQVADYNVLEDRQLQAKGVLDFIRRAFAGESAHVPAIQYDPNETIPDRTNHDDPRRWVAAVVYPLKDAAGRIREVVLVHDDITARKRAEEALLVVHRELEGRVAARTAELVRANEFLKALLENVQTGVVACDAEGVLTLFNGVTRELHGLPEESIPSERWAERYCLYRPDGQTPMVREDVPLYRALRGERVRDAEMVIAPAGTPPRIVLNSGQAFYDAQGEKLGAVVSMQDVTARKQAEAALRQAHDELERRVGERTEQLARANEALRDADRRKDEFLATLAHELRNPLAPISNSLQLLKMPRVDAAMVRQSRDMMERQVHQLVRLVDDLLDVSRVMRGKIELRREPVELATVVARAVETAQPLIQVRGHRLDLSIPPESLLLDADPVRLAQVVGNLLTNAAKYTEANGRIWLNAEQESGRAVLRVRDNGIGIAPDVLPHVFDLFMQVDYAATRSQGGLGIGLTLVKNLVEMHGGTVEARSEGLGRGCEFVVRLPLLSTAHRKSGEGGISPPQIEPVRASGHRLLVVDDNRDAAVSLAMLLQLQGHEVKVAHDGPAALALAASYRPHVVFLDLGMPGMDGYEVAQRIRRQPGQENVVLAALTGWGQQEDRRRTAEAGFNHHLVKPPEPKAVEGLLADLKRSGGA